MSTTLGGVVAEHFGYASSFIALGGVALFALALWIVAPPLMSETKLALKPA